MSNLRRRITEEDEQEFFLRSREFYRPPLKQIGNSIYEIKTHYMLADAVNVIPSMCTTQLAGIRDTLLTHLEEDSFLYKNNIVNGSTIENEWERKRRSSSFIVLMDSLALAMDFEVSHRPVYVQCDMLLAICGQPVIVLTLVDGDKDSETVTLYHSSVAKGVTSTLCRFMDETINIVSGVLHRQDMDTMDTFKTAIEKIAEESAFFVTLNSFSTSASKYEKILTAFWAGVAETKSITNTNGRVDTDYLRFLTKDQCIILMENINNREVEVQFQPGTGATTLMVEVARRLARLDQTLLVCRSQEEKERLRSACGPLTTADPDDLCCLDLSSFQHVVDESGKIILSKSGRFWRFSRVNLEIEKLKHKVDLLQKERDYREKIISLLYYEDRQKKMEHLLWEIETLKLLDINFQQLLSAYHLPNSTAFEFIPVKRHSVGEGSSEQTLETQERVRIVLDELKTGLLERRNLFSLVQNEIIQDKRRIPCLQAKTDFLKRATSDDPLLDDSESQNRCFASMEPGEDESTQSSDTCEDSDLWSAEEEYGGHVTLSPDDDQEADEHEPTTLLDMEKNDAWSTDDDDEEEDGGHVTSSPDDEEEADEHAPTTLLDMEEEVAVSCNNEEAVESLSLDVPGMEEDELSGTEEGKAGEPIESIESLYMKEDGEQEGEMKLDHRIKPQSQSINEDSLPCDVDGAVGEGATSTESPNTETDDSKTIQSLKLGWSNLEMEAQSLDRWIRERPEAEEFCVEWEETMAYLSHEMSGLRIGEFITNVIGGGEIPEAPGATAERFTYKGNDQSPRSGELRRDLIYKLRKMEYGKMKRKDIWNILKNVIEGDHCRLANLRTQSDCLEREYGSPIHMVGEIGTSHGGPVSCPPMTFNRERVYEELAVSGDGLELVNWRETLDHRTDRFKNYNGTSSLLPIPLPPSPSILTAATYWETHTRLQVKNDVSLRYLLEMAVCEEGKVDTESFVSLQDRSSWALLVGYCDKHPGHVCTKVWMERRQVGECQTDTMSPTPGTDVTLKYGIALNVGQGRLAFIDVNRGRVLHKFDVNFRESLFPMFSVWPLPDDVHATMRLISGREVAMTGEKQQLIVKALFCK